MTHSTRRHFIKQAATASTLAAFPRFSIGQSGGSANSRLNVAFVGAGGRAATLIKGLNEENFVAFCDVDDAWAAKTYREYPDVPRFKDFREMLDKKGREIDAVCVATPDHTHFVAAYSAMERGKHVLTEKPLTHNIWQARTLRKAAKRFGAITQMGNQGHATEGIRYVKEWYEAGAIGEVDEVIAYNPGPKFRPTGSFKRPPRIPPTSQAIPDTLNWDLWKGPTAPNIKYNEIYLPKSWRSFFQFGNGQLGDWACHTLDAPFWALELGMPSKASVRDVDEPWPGMPALRSVVEWEFPRTGKTPLTLTWHEGYTPSYDPSDGQAEWGKDIGMAMIGSKGTITHGIRPDSPRLYPEAYWQDFRRNLPDKRYDRIKGSHIDEWARAIKGEGPMPGSNFDYAARLTEMALLGVLAQKTQSTVEWDAKAMRVTNKPELNVFIEEPVRRGWEMGQEVWT